MVDFVKIHRYCIATKVVYTDPLWQHDVTNLIVSIVGNDCLNTNQASFTLR